MRGRLAGLFGPLLFTCIAGAILACLGLWQLQRLAWKTELIARIEARAKAAPDPLPAPTEWPSLRPEAYEYRHVAFDGRFENDKEALVFRASGGGARQPGLSRTRLRSGSRQAAM